MSKRRNNNIRVQINDHAYFTVGFLPSHMIQTDPEYQRCIERSRVQQIADEFDPGIVSLLRVSHRDGKYFVFDGGHTLSALKIVNQDRASFPVLCLIYENLTREEEARLFAKQRGIEKAVSFRVRLNANLIGKEEKAQGLVKATEEGGLSLAVKERREGMIWAVEKANYLLSKYGEERYKETLSLVKDTWNGSQDSLASNMLGGVAAFLKEFGDVYDRKRFIKKLKDMPPKEIQTNARRNKASYQNMDESYATEMAVVYNRGQGKCKLDHTCVCY